MKIKLISKLFLILTFGQLTACQSDLKFEKGGWNQQNDLESYPLREKMINDLLKNNKLKGLTFKQLTDKIGFPEKNWEGSNNEIFYPITVDFGNDIDPVYSKTLIIKLDNDSIVADYQVKEIEK